MLPQRLAARRHPPIILSGGGTEGRVEAALRAALPAETCFVASEDRQTDVCIGGAAFAAAPQARAHFRAGHDIVPNNNMTPVREIPDEDEEARCCRNKARAGVLKLAPLLGAQPDPECLDSSVAWWCALEERCRARLGGGIERLWGYRRREEELRKLVSDLVQTEQQGPAVHRAAPFLDTQMIWYSNGKEQIIDMLVDVFIGRETSLLSPLPPVVRAGGDAGERAADPPPWGPPDKGCIAGMDKIETGPL